MTTEPTFEEKNHLFFESLASLMGARDLVLVYVNVNVYTYIFIYIYM